jgi:hypothetical protein
MGHFLVWHFAHQFWKAVKLYFTTYLSSHNNQDRLQSSGMWCVVYYGWKTPVFWVDMSLSSKWKSVGKVKMDVASSYKMLIHSYYSMLKYITEGHNLHSTEIKQNKILTYILIMTCLLYIEFSEMTRQITHLPETHRLLTIFKMESCTNLSWHSSFIYFLID